MSSLKIKAQIKWLQFQKEVEGTCQIGWMDHESGGLAGDRNYLNSVNHDKWDTEFFDISP